jgi:hypothetical protein
LHVYAVENNGRGANENVKAVVDLDFSIMSSAPEIVDEEEEEGVFEDGKRNCEEEGSHRSVLLNGFGTDGEDDDDGLLFEVFCGGLDGEAFVGDTVFGVDAARLIAVIAAELAADAPFGRRNDASLFSDLGDAEGEEDLTVEDDGALVVQV